MAHKTLWWVAKGLEAAGLIVVLVGVVISIQLGLGEEGLASMQYEMKALMAGLALFVAGWALERKVGSR